MKKIKDFWFNLKISIAFLFLYLMLRLDELLHNKVVFTPLAPEPKELPEVQPPLETSPEPIKTQNGVIVPAIILEKIKNDRSL